MSEAPEIVEEVEESFTDEESYDFRNYMTIGRISETVDILGHKVVLRTLSVEEDLAVGLLIKPFLGSNSYERAYRTAILAAAVRRIDNDMMPEPISEDDELMEIMRVRFDKVKKFYPIFLDEVYKRFTEMEKQLMPVVSRLGKISS